ncbi:MAG TPA: amidase [Candidatus Binataceae bacterium]|nr:amidase [Candidatus Binataceae bacterium]
MLNPWIEAYELRELVLNKEVRPREVAEFFLNRIERLNPRLGAFMTVTADRALDDAARLERISDSDRAAMPLFGVAYSLKDLTWTKGIRTTLGSKNFENFIPHADQEYAARITAAGGILLGKTTTPEFGGKPTTDGGLCPTARNPWNPAHTAGGSSGGAAAAVAAGMHPIAEGSDGGGSIRLPAACCGIVGIKPSRGRVSSAPVMGEAWAGFATNGPLARSVRDAALLLDVMAGPVDGDPYWAPPPRHRFADAINVRPRKLRLAALCATALGPVDPEIRTAFESACDSFRAMGHGVEPITVDPAARLREIAEKLICAGISSIPVKDPDLMDPVVRAAWDRGRKVGASEYISTVLQMHNVSRLIVQELMPFDALLTPTLPRPAVPLGSLYSEPATSMDATFGWIPFTFPFNATGQPAISLPNGFTKARLPIGLQIVGRPADETGIIALAAAFEEARPWRGQRPPVD